MKKNLFSTKKKFGEWKGQILRADRILPLDKFFFAYHFGKYAYYLLLSFKFLVQKKFAPGDTIPYEN